MLKKLFAYDFRCISRMTLPTLIGMVLTALLSLLFLWIAEVSSAGNIALISVLGTLGFIACLFILILFAVAPAYINYFHFGKNLFFDEGYLTMTLPASEHQILLSKLFAGFLWLLLDVLMAIVSLCILLFGAICIFGGAVEPLPDSSMVTAEIAAMLGDILSAIPIYLLFVLVYMAFEVVLGMAVITFGCLMMPKHKILGILLTYVVTNWIVGFVNQLITSAVSLSLLAFDPSEANLYAAPAIMTGIIAVLTVLCYFLTHRMLKKRINLE